MADEIFKQADVNKDQRLDLDEFRNLIAQSLGARSANQAAGAYQSSGANAYGDLSNVSGSYGGAANSAGASYNTVDAGAGAASYTSYDQSSYGSTSGIEASSFDASAASSYGVSGLEGNTYSGAGLSIGNVGVSSSTFETSSSQQQLQVDPSNPRNLYRDPNPQIIRRPAQGGELTYAQNIKVRFLQPPQVPPPGPLIIKEVRPPQPPPLPPLRVRQQAPPLPQPPPLVLRERPPNPPASVASQTVIRRLAALAVPPRSVIIERLPPLPPKPRDIIIERWVPYGAQAKRRTIVQRAAAAQGYAKPRNIIIQYEPIRVRVVRQFQRLGVIQENPAAYFQRYGASLLDAQTLLQQARAAGVVEDIAPPNNFAATGTSSSSFNAEFNSASSGIDAIGGNIGTSLSSFGSSSYGVAQQGNASFSGLESSQGNAGIAFGGAAIGDASASGFQGYSAPTGGFNSSGTDPATAAFLAADLNKDGALNAEEFRQFLSSNLRLQ